MKVLRKLPLSLASIFSLAALLQAAEPPPATGPAQPNQALETAPWENVSDEFFKKLDVYEMKPAFMRRCVGMAVAPSGEVFILTSKNHGICISKDHGATWAVAPGNNVTGRCETGFGFSMAYPYDGRLAFFSIDGTGGMTLDGGGTWRPFAKLLRMFEFADVDWTSKDSPTQTIFGLLHEPYYTALSTDSGTNWRQIYKDAESPKEMQGTVSKHLLGVIDANTLVRSHRDHDGISMTTDAGTTWTEVAKYKVLGRRPVHYGKNVYWTAAEGVIVTTNGKDWTLTGHGPENALYGPYFGESEQEFMVVSDKAFFITWDGGKTWKDVAAVFTPPDAGMKGFNARGSFNYFGWDAKDNFLYASSLGASVYRLRLER